MRLTRPWKRLSKFDFFPILAGMAVDSSTKTEAMTTRTRIVFVFMAEL